MKTKAEALAAGVPEALIQQADACGVGLPGLSILWVLLKAAGCSAAPTLRPILAAEPPPWNTLALAVLDVLCPPGAAP